MSPHSPSHAVKIASHGLTTTTTTEATTPNFEAFSKLKTFPKHTARSNAKAEKTPETTKQTRNNNQIARALATNTNSKGATKAMLRTQKIRPEATHERKKTNRSENRRK
jgi:hypothetical protein